MLEKLEQTEARYEELTAQLSLPEVYSDQAAYAKLAKQHRAMGEMVDEGIHHLKTTPLMASGVSCWLTANR